MPRSSNLSTCSAILFVLLIVSPAWVHAETVWEAIPPEDLALKDNPKMPGSSAMILLKEEFHNFKDERIEVHYRIKIFREEGRKHGDISIPYWKGEYEIKELAARTVQPDGQSNEFRGVVFDKILLSSKGVNYRAKSIPLPDVRPGSVVEYRYVMKGTSGGLVFDVQEGLYIRECRLKFQVPQSDFLPYIKYLQRPKKFGDDFVNEGKGNYSATFQDIPPFESEEVSPPEEILQWRYFLAVAHYEGGGFDFPVMMSTERFWSKHGEDLAEQQRKFLGKPDSMKNVVRTLVAAQDAPTLKLRKIYAAIQQKVRNLSYEETYSKRERRTEGIKERKSAQDVWDFGYGDAAQIAGLLVAMCRAANIACDPVYVSRRDGFFLDKEMEQPYMLRDVLVVAELPEGPQFLDIGSRLASFGAIDWPTQGVAGMRIKEKVGEWIEVPLHDSAKNSTSRTTHISLQPDGKATVEVDTRLSAQAAMGYRNMLYELTDTQREFKLKEMLEDSFPSAEIKSVSWTGIDSTADEVTLKYQFEAPGFGILRKERMMFQPLIYTITSPLPNRKRTSSVYFHYPYVQADEVRVTLPEGYVLDSALPPGEIGGGAVEYAMTLEQQGGELVFKRKFALHEIYYQDTPRFLQLKNFFDVVQLRDQTYLILRKQ